MNETSILKFLETLFRIFSVEQKFNYEKENKLSLNITRSMEKI